MAEKKELSLNLSAGDEEPCTQAAEEACIGVQSAPKRKKAPTAVLDGCAPKRRGEEEAWRAVDSQLKVLEGEEGDDEDDEELRKELKARYAATVHRLLDNHPNVVWVDFPSCCVRPPGVEFPKPPSTRRPYGQDDAIATEEEGELGGAVYDVATPLVSA